MKKGFKKSKSIPLIKYLSLKQFPSYILQGVIFNVLITRLNRLSMYWKVSV